VRCVVLIMMIILQSLNAAEKTFTVDAQWMAQYRAMVVMFKYPIPEEKQIRFEGGKFIVPLVVYRHFEDMTVAATKREQRR
jgi:hypothetical protein